MSVKDKPHGGSFLIQDTNPDAVFIPEDLNEEQHMMIRSFREFYEREIVPVHDEIEKRNWEVISSLYHKVAELGVFMSEVGEEDSGLGLDVVTTSAIVQECGTFGSFSTTILAHQSIGMFPLIGWGTRAQIEKYLPGLMDGSVMGAYALTEPGSGSDALAVKTTAKLNEEKTHYILDGTKQFISNAGWAGLFAIFAKIDGDKFTAFLVERDCPGLEIGPEEDKLGIKGSSTCSVIMRDAKVPVENVLGEIGQGHKIALNCLNPGRLKLGFGSTGVCKVLLRIATQYAIERQQFGRPICEFGLIQHKLGEMAARTFASESMVYRIAGLVQETIDADAEEDSSPYTKKMKAFYEFTAECALAKVHSTEVLDYVVDEAVQIHGGYGFIEEYPVSRFYRDTRITRLYEGTSEICRLHAVGSILKLVAKGKLNLMGAVLRLRPNEAPDSSRGRSDDLTSLLSQVNETKKICLHLGGLISQHYPSPEQLMEKQEFIGNLADVMIEILASESTTLRAIKIQERCKVEDANVFKTMAFVYTGTAAERIRKAASEILAGLFSGDDLRAQVKMISGWLPLPVDTIALRRSIANILLENKGQLPEIRN